jgi:hypothetical protein
VFVNTKQGKLNTRRKNDLGGVDARLTARGKIIEEDNSVLCEAMLDREAQVPGQAPEYGSPRRGVRLSPCSLLLSTRASSVIRVLCRDVSEVPACAAEAVIVPNDHLLESSTRLTSTILASAFPTSANVFVENVTTRGESGERLQLSIGDTLVTPKGELTLLITLFICAFQLSLATG